VPDQEKIVHPYNDQSGRWESIAEVFCGGYNWGIACVWRDKANGRLYGDTDSGCSCYGPFEDGGFGGFSYTGIGALTEVTTREEAGALLDNVYGEDGGPSTTEVLDFVRDVEIALGDSR
jgi:hypothetical protein